MVFADCSDDAVDEEVCSFSESEIRRHAVIEADNCYSLGDYIPCGDGRCFKQQHLCQYDLNPAGDLAPCKNGRHLQYLCDQVICSYSFKCFQSYCIPLRRVCDQQFDCPFQDDEIFCDNLTCPGFLRCFNSTVCVPPWEVCDGVADCTALAEDELTCAVTCPQHCHCDGLVAICSAQSFNTLVTADASVLFKAFVFPEGIMNISVPQLQGASYLFIDGLVTNHNLDWASSNTSSLAALHFINANLISISSHLLQSSLLYLLNCSHNNIANMEKDAFQLSTSIEILILTNNMLSHLPESYFSDLKKLRVLFLDGNDVVYISLSFSSHLLNIEMVRSEWYFICCITDSAVDCLSLSNALSSCSNLLNSVFLQHYLRLQYASLMINAAVMLHSYKSTSDAMTFSDYHYAASHLLMAFYLSYLSTVDSYFRGRLRTVSRWLYRSTICQAASAVFTTSFLVSLYLQAALFVFKAKVVQLPDKDDFRLRKTKSICRGVWATVLLSIVTLNIYLLAFGDFESMKAHSASLLGLCRTLRFSACLWPSDLCWLFRCLVASLS